MVEHIYIYLCTFGIYHAGDKFRIYQKYLITRAHVVLFYLSGNFQESTRSIKLYIKHLMKKTLNTPINERIYVELTRDITE